VRKPRILDGVWRACRRQDGDLTHQPALGLRYEAAHIRVGQRLAQNASARPRTTAPSSPAARTKGKSSTPSMTPRASGSASAMVARRRRIESSRATSMQCLAEQPPQATGTHAAAPGPSSSTGRDCRKDRVGLLSAALLQRCRNVGGRPAVSDPPGTGPHRPPVWALGGVAAHLRSLRAPAHGLASTTVCVRT
jgi:hypothetical protein